MEVTGKIMEYEHENGEAYRLLFGLDCVTWECLSGSAAGSITTVSCGAAEIESNVLFIAWSEDDGDAVSIVADLKKNSLHCWQVNQGSRNFWKGKIKSFTDAQIKDT
jgi:hypothetical protein